MVFREFEGESAIVEMDQSFPRCLPCLILCILIERIKVVRQFGLRSLQGLRHQIASILITLGNPGGALCERQNDGMLPINDPDNIVFIVHQNIARREIKLTQRWARESVIVTDH
jgi:hypothetical protein